MENLQRYEGFEHVYQVVSWLGTLTLLVIVGVSPGSSPAMTSLLVFLAALLGISSLLFANLLPMKSDGFVKYEPEDKVLIESLVMILLLTAFLYIKPLTSSGFFILLIPILIGSIVLHERIIFAEAAFASVAVVFLGIAGRGIYFYRGTDFFLEIGIFLAIVVLMYGLTRQLRKSSERNTALSENLSRRLDQIQVIGMLVEQSEHFQHFNLLLERIGEITADAFDAEQCGFFLLNDDKKLYLHLSSVGFKEYDRDVYNLESNMVTILSVFKDWRVLMINNEVDAERENISGLIGDRHIKNFLLLPLGVKHGRIGVIMIANRRGESFDSHDLHFLQLLAGFISTLIDSAESFMHVEEERKSAQKLTKLLVGRELKMKEMKKQLRERGL